MTDFFYPPIDAVTMRNLSLIKQLMQEHPAFFHGDHPYSAAMETLLKSWFSGAAIAQKAREDRQALDEANSGTITLEDDRDGYLYQETEKLYTSMQTAKYSGDEGDSMSYYRTQASLLEKMIGYRERALGLKQLAENNKLILHIMDKVLNQEQRDQVMAELKAKLNP